MEWYQKIEQIIIPERTIPKVKAVASLFNWNYRLSTDRARSVFGWQPRPYQQTIVEMAESLIEHGFV